MKWRTHDCEREYSTINRERSQSKHESITSDLISKLRLDSVKGQGRVFFFFKAFDFLFLAILRNISDRFISCSFLQAFV